MGTKKRNLGAIALVVILVCIGVGGLAYNHFRQRVSASTAGLPASFQGLQNGMTQAEVVGLVGQPVSKTVNPGFEQKTPQEWAAIEAQSDAQDSDNGDITSTPTLSELKIGAELPHRTKVTWRYVPNSLVFVTIKFDGGGNVIGWSTGPLPQARK